MNRTWIILTSISLFACGSDNENTVEVNDGDQSSVVATTNPQTGNSSGHSENDGHNHGSADEKITTIEYFETSHNFGNVFYPSENKFTFKFKNTGNNPLIIEEATASCGCTVPNKPDKPIAPGEVGEMDVIFRPKEGQVGQTVTKNITVKANTVPSESHLEITATVLEGM
jgi:hypothetical protein